MIGRDARINLLISTGHFLSHFYQLCLPPLFLVWQRQFDISFAELGLSVVLMTGTAAVLQTPVGFLVDRYGARPFLIGGALVMSLAIALMAFATAFWQILALALISGIGNSVFHPCDYAILAGSIRKERMGRSFALHGFSGNIGFALAPPTIAALLSVMDWRGVLLVVGGLGLPVVAAVIAQSHILRDQVRKDTPERGMSMRALLLDRTLGLFFLFYFLGAMASGGVTAWLITVLHEVKGLDLALASAALTAYMAGSGGGVLLGGWAADKSTRYLAFFVAGLTSFSAVAILVVNLVPMGGLATIGLMLALGHGARRQPDAARCDAQGRGAARPDRQGLRLRQRRLAAGKRRDAGPLRLSDRPRPCRARADRGGGISAGEPSLHGQRKGLGQASRHRGGGRVIRARRAASRGGNRGDHLDRGGVGARHPDRAIDARPHSSAASTSRGARRPD